jgi:NAD(P)-dependent dehydrogenase (short-subunit alcohol dehydrogenase family)
VDHHLYLFGSSGNIGTEFVKQISEPINQIWSSIHLIDISIKDDEDYFKHNTRFHGISLDLKDEAKLTTFLSNIDRKSSKTIVIFAAKDYPVIGNAADVGTSFGKSLNEFRDLLEINLLMPYTIVKLAIDQKWLNTRIVFCGSIYGTRCPYPSLYSDDKLSIQNMKPAPYAISKGALIPLVKYAGLELGRHKGDAFMLSFGGIHSETHSEEFVKKYSEISPSYGLLTLNKVAQTIHQMIRLPVGVLNCGNIFVDNGYTAF